MSLVDISCSLPYLSNVIVLENWIYLKILSIYLSIYLSTSTQAHCDAMTNPSDQTEPVYDILLRAIDGSLIPKMALRSSGSAGPSGMDAATLKCLHNSFKSSSNLLCDALASFAGCLTPECVDPKDVAAFFACRLYH